MNLSYYVNRKAYSSEPTFGTYEEIFQDSRLPRENIFPYPFYFVSNPFSETAQIHDRRAGWSPQQTTTPTPVKRDPYPQHCFQPPCNTVQTLKKTDNGCLTNDCIVLDR